MNPTHHKKFLVHISIIAFFVIVASTFLASGLYMIATMTSEAFAKESELHNAQAEQLDRYTYKDIIKNSASDREKIGKYFLKKEQIVLYIEALEDLAVQTNTTIDTTVSPQVVQDFELQINGTYANVSRFISLLEQLPYYSNIRSITLVKNDEIGTSTLPRWVAQIKVTLVSFLP